MTLLTFGNMLHLREHTSGIDCEIQEMQRDIYKALTEVFNFQNVEGYGRLYRKERIEGTFPEWYNSVTGDYEITYLDDTKNVIFSFIDGEDHTSRDGFTYVAPVKIVFWFNLDAIQSKAYRDSEAQRIASVILNKEITTTFTYDRLQKGIRKVYSGFNVNDIRFKNKQPYHVFSLNINLTYHLTKKC